MKPKYFSQAGMELSCKIFNQRINSETDHRGDSFHGLMRSRLESCCYESQSLILSFPVSEHLRNPVGVMHGGAVAGAMDITMGSLTYYFSGEILTPTINMNTSYERPIPVGSRLFVKATLLSKGKTMLFASAKAWVEGQEEKISASATGTYFAAGNSK